MREAKINKIELDENYFQIISSKIRHWFLNLMKDFKNISKEINKPHFENIEVYKLIAEFKTPMANSDKIANCGIGDFLIIINDVVWIQDKNFDRKEQYAETMFSSQFVKINPSIFQKQ